MPSRARGCESRPCRPRRCSHDGALHRDGAAERIVGVPIDATEQARLIRSGEASASELLEESIASLERLNPQLNAVIHPLLDEAREAVAAGLPDGPFRGVPFLVKDLSCYMAGAPVHEGNRALRDAGHRADHDMWLAQRFRQAGFV